ncbi:hypothetical protein KC19_12G182100 [Ceratodon purpureus]|uniref:Uncharacterized protein n=1 Tax=Ceratodon purpureus TaxID=3225 RepID=A0A8T0G8S0_CERPU|nr:hypothetical protein KC19_12G182100 [Ceratodon purpureus]
MATSAGYRDAFAALLLVALVVLAAGTQSASATRSYGRHEPRSMRAKVRNHMKKETCVMNGVAVPPGATREVEVTRVKLTITIKVVVKGKSRPVYTMPVSRDSWAAGRDFLLEINDCSACRNCAGCSAGLLCLRVTIKGRERARVCPIRIGATPPPPPPPIVLPPVLPPVAAPPVTLPPVTLPPVALPPVAVPPVAVPPVAVPPVALPPVVVPPLGPILAPIVDPLVPIVAPITAPLGPILAPIVDPLVPIVAPITAPIAPILAPVVDPLAPIVAPITAPLGPILAPILAPAVTPIVAPIVAPLAPILSPILTPITSPILPPLTGIPGLP